MGVITPVWQSFGVLPEHQVTWHTQVSQRTLWFKDFSISGRISSRPAAFTYVYKRPTSCLNNAAITFHATQYLFKKFFELCCVQKV